MAAVNGGNCCCTVSSNVRTLLAKSVSPLRRQPKCLSKGFASWVRMGLPGPASHEQTANSDFANRVRPFVKVKHHRPGRMVRSGISARQASPLPPCDRGCSSARAPGRLTDSPAHSSHM